MIELPADARVILCDVWGVLHDGVAAFPSALAALSRWRGEGRVVVLVTNAPRPSAAIARQLARLGLAPHFYDALVTSGDAGLAFVRDRGGRWALIGTEHRCRGAGRGGLRRGRPGGRADRRVHWLRRPAPDVADYDDTLMAMRDRGALLACFNPDRVVLHDGRRIVCAGAIADRYVAMGGEAVFTGKPFPPIYDRALALAGERLGRPVDRAKTIAIGDGIATDMAGAARADLRFLFVADGIEREAIAGTGLDRVFADAAARHDLGTFRPFAAVDALA